jgi:predicted small integral membrane protein
MSNETEIKTPPRGGASAKEKPTRWGAVYLATAVVLLVILGLIYLAAPREGGEVLWTEQMTPGGWMAWSFPVAVFFWAIGSVLVVFTLLAVRYPETPRVGILGIETTRGDRLFITLLGSAFINLAWLGLEPGPQLWALALCAVYATLVFWKV